MFPSYIILADCECITKKIHDQPGKVQEHIPMMNSLYVIPNTCMIACLLDVGYISFEEARYVAKFCMKLKEICKAIS